MPQRHDLGRLTLHAELATGTEKMQRGMRRYIGCRFPIRMADGDVSTRAFAEFSSKWRTRFLIFVANPETVRLFRNFSRAADRDTGRGQSRCVPGDAGAQPDYYLASPSGSWITGQVISPNGGTLIG